MKYIQINTGAIISYNETQKTIKQSINEQLIIPKGNIQLSHITQEYSNIIIIRSAIVLEWND
jgi:hypothetical protein